MEANNSLENQRIRILQCLRKGSASTFYFRETEGICSPAARICELRRKGFEITTSYTCETDASGVRHNHIAVYTLHGEPN